MTSKERATRLICLNAVVMQNEFGVLPRDWKQTWITHACAIRDKSTYAFLSFWIAYLHALDRESINSAAQHLEGCLERIRYAPKGMRRLALMEAAAYQALHRIDVEKANVWFELSKVPGSTRSLMESRLSACMHWVRREYAEMITAWQQGLDYIESMPESRLKGSQKLGWVEWKEYLEKKREEREQTFGPDDVS